MAAKDDTSKVRRGRNSASAKRPAKQPARQQATSAPKPASAALNPRTLEDIVEDERLRLMQAHSILCCVATGMADENICTGDGPYWPAVIESARDLINASIRNLEGLEYSPKPARSPDEVRERSIDYIYGASRRSSFFTGDAGSSSKAVSAIEFLHGSSYREVGQANTAAALAP